MLGRHFARMLGAFVLAAAPVAAAADTGWSVVLDSDSCCCTDAGGGRGTFVVNNETTLVTYRIDYTLSALPAALHIHAPVLPGEHPVDAPMAITLAGDFQDRGCGAMGFRMVAGACGTLSGAGAIDPTIVGWMTDGLAWVVVHTAAHPNGEACGRIQSDATPARATSWGRVKIRYR